MELVIQSNYSFSLKPTTGANLETVTAFRKTGIYEAFTAIQNYSNKILVRCLFT